MLKNKKCWGFVPNHQQNKPNKQKKKTRSTKTFFFAAPTGTYVFDSSLKTWRHLNFCLRDSVNYSQFSGYQQIASMKTLRGKIRECFSTLRCQKKRRGTRVALLTELHWMRFPGWKSPSSQGRCLGRAGRSPWRQGQHPGPLEWWWKVYQTWVPSWLKTDGIVWPGLFNFMKCQGMYWHSPECLWINKCWQAYFT